MKFPENTIAITNMLLIATRCLHFQLAADMEIACILSIKMNRVDMGIVFVDATCNDPTINS